MSELNFGFGVKQTRHSLDPATLTEPLVEPNLPIAYSIAFDWGALRVTEAANNAYDFVPLVEGVKKGDFAGSDENLVDIRLIGPSEIPERVGADSRPMPGFFLISDSSGAGISVDAGLYKGRHESVEQLSTSLKEFMAESMELENSEELIAAFDEEEVDLDGDLEKQLPQMMLHALCDAIRKNVSKSLAANLRTSLDERVYHNQTRPLVLAFLGSAGVNLGIGPSAPAELISGGMLGASILLTRRNLKKYAKQASNKEHLVRVEAATMATQVHEDLLSTYSTDHFDQRISEQFQEKDGDQ